MEREVIQLATFLPPLKFGPYSEQQVNCLAGPSPTQSDLEDTVQWMVTGHGAGDCCAELLELGNHSPHHPTPKVTALWLWMKCLLSVRISTFMHAHTLPLCPHDATQWVLTGHLFINLYEVMLFQNVKPKAVLLHLVTDVIWPPSAYHSKHCLCSL